MKNKKIRQKLCRYFDEVKTGSTRNGKDYRATKRGFLLTVNPYSDGGYSIYLVKNYDIIDSWFAESGAELLKLINTAAGVMRKNEKTFLPQTKNEIIAALNMAQKCRTWCQASFKMYGPYMNAYREWILKAKTKRYEKENFNNRRPENKQP